MKQTVVLSMLLVACAGDGSGGLDLSARDPRCVAACPETMPDYEGVGEVCNVASRVACLDECEARIAGVSNLCQSCLVEDSCFGPRGCSGNDGLGASCTNNTCTISSTFGTCTYNSSDEAAKLRCYQQVNPRREVACSAEFRPTTECAPVCSG
jgi:hypothetical protein